MPSDFADRARLYGIAKLKAMYGTNQRTVERWRREAGVVYVVPNAAPKVIVAVRRRKMRPRRFAPEAIEDLEQFDVRNYRDLIGC